ncbi:RagB/SusD family nutrient uptake outer membrane protein [Chitinophagaceae bacterium LB-8]|uniref:RagB/SusD family nutrient uptake outer membrane protein n=1 Tax=Paraflavisolibacter caeni TaxID=2982496 RepID=A0A9X2XP00_9BACT|nr:RagB/SusD family nutrient uptake outer membrane protein [Paraflavisolibacter caeni]MCU7550078.1 RagB/SusD family nutrient uptake outer membrane protein [Paraflavisolibacter caeni]
MKKINRYIYSGAAILVLLPFLFSACTKLKDTSYNTIIAREFTPDSTDLAALAGAAYVDWRGLLLQWNTVYRAQEVSADQMLTPARPNGWVDGGVYRRIHEHKWTTEDDIVINIWTRAYQGITNSNRIIYQVQSGAIPVDPKDTTTLIAEMKLLRASYYWILCDIYGNVPIVDRFDVPAGYLPKQNTRKEVYDFIVNDLVTNIPKVSTENNKTTYGKFNKWAGLALLAKMYLNAGVYTGTPQWEKCKEVCDEIIDSKLFILEPNQKNVFVTNNENSKEIIFALPFDSKYVNDWNSFDVHMQTLQPENQKTYNLQFSPWGGVCAIPQFISTFDPEDSRLLDNFIMGQQYTSTGDSIYGTMGAYVGKPLSYRNYVPGVDVSEEVDGLRLGKFEIAAGSTNRLSNDWPLFRYADILMMKAESLMRSGDADGAAAIVTEVRKRAFKLNPARAVVTGADLLKGSSYDYGLRNHLVTTTEGGADIQYGRFLDELAWEFNQEARRRTDLIRFGVFTKKSWLSHSPNGDYRSLYPIPRTEIAKNSNLKQNPGYN